MKSPLLCAAGILLLSSSAHACEGASSIKELTQAAKVIYIGKVLSVGNRKGKRQDPATLGNGPKYDYRIQVEEVLKGSLTEKELALIDLNSPLGKTAQPPEDTCAIHLRVGARYLVFKDSTQPGGYRELTNGETAALMKKMIEL